MVFGLSWRMAATCSAVNKSSIAAPDPSGDHCVRLAPRKILYRSINVNSYL
jgi:hypothetical protein